MIESLPFVKSTFDGEINELSYFFKRGELFPIEESNESFLNTILFLEL
jgi:hypothetical protein